MSDLADKKAEAIKLLENDDVQQFFVVTLKKDTNGYCWFIEGFDAVGAIQAVFFKLQMSILKNEVGG